MWEQLNCSHFFVQMGSKVSDFGATNRINDWSHWTPHLSFFLIIGLSIRGKMNKIFQEVPLYGNKQ